MKTRLTQEDIEDLLSVCGTSPTVWNAHGNMQVCCPIHGEVHPSCGVSSDKQVFNCFSCGASGSFPWMLYLSQPDQFPSYKSAVEFIQNEYGATYEVSEKSHDIMRYEDVKEEKYVFKEKTIPRYKIAPYMSGKETYKYFFNRGFTEEDMREFMIGRDLIHKTVTIPVFNEEDELLGVLGRYISKDRLKNERYKIYDHFNRGNYLYPLNKFEENGTIILLEGQFDAIRMHSLGYHNALAKMGLELTKPQARWIKNHCDRVIDICDNDNRGREALEADAEMLKGVRVLRVDYPDYGKDPCEWEEDDIRDMIENAGNRNRKIKRFV